MSYSWRPQTSLVHLNESTMGGFWGSSSNVVVHSHQPLPLETTDLRPGSGHSGRIRGRDRPDGFGGGPGRGVWDHGGGEYVVGTEEVESTGGTDTITHT